MIVENPDGWIVALWKNLLNNRTLTWKPQNLGCQDSRNLDIPLIQK
jgi:hypothetical protein